MDNYCSDIISLVEKYISKVVKEAVSEAFSEQKGKSPCYPERVSVEQASEITGYSRNSLYQMHSKKQVPGAIKVGGKLMFDTATLQQWVAEGGRR